MKVPIDYINMDNEVCMMHDYLYTQKEERVCWYHYLMVTFIICAIIWANAERIVE